MAPTTENTMRLVLRQDNDWINANHRYGHWAQKAKLTKAWREQAETAAILHSGYFVGRVRIVVTVHKTTNRRYDVGNLAPTAKAIVDGLVSAGVLVDDSNEYVEGPDLRAGEKRDAACVVVTIEQIPARDERAFTPVPF